MSKRALEELVAEKCTEGSKMSGLFGGEPKKPRSETTKPTAFLRLPRVMARVGGMSKSWIYLEISKGRFPAPIQLARNGRAVAWLEDEIDEYLAGRVAETRRRFAK